MARPSLYWPLGLLVTLAVLSASCSETSSAVPPRHLLLVTVDTLRADHLSLYGYRRATSPRLDALAAEGVVFEWAIAQWPKTGASFASLFTGRYPESTGLTHRAALSVPESFEILPQVLQREGFTTVAVVSNAVLSRNQGWARGFDEYLQTWGETDDFPDDPAGFRPLLWAGRVNELALPLLARRASAQRLFAWIHYSDPHAPYLLPAGVANPFAGDRWDEGGETVEPGMVGTRGLAGVSRLAEYVTHYDANLRLVDDAIHELLTYARDLGLVDNAVVVITADHGESLGEHGSYLEHGPLPYNTTSRVPLVILAPGLEGGRRVETPVELVDLFPTLRDLLLPERAVATLEGSSLASLLAGTDSSPGRAMAFAGAGRPPRHYRTVQDGRFKLVHHPAHRRAGFDVPLLELYDLDRDPGESRNMADDPAYAAELRHLWRRLEGWMEGGEMVLVTGDEEPDEQTRRALRALGYLE